MSDRVWKVLGLGLVSWMVGCGGQSTLDMATTPAEAKTTITEALDSWKKGVSQKDLSERKPPLYLQDNSYAKGTQLVDYSFENEGKVVGTGMSYIVNLKLKGEGEGKTRRVAYRVVTTPNRAVTLEDGIP
jgi:hypothetical protein